MGSVRWDPYGGIGLEESVWRDLSSGISRALWDQSRLEGTLRVSNETQTAQRTAA